MAQAVVAQIRARGRVVGAEALPAIALVSAGGVTRSGRSGVTRSRRSGVARSRRIGIGGAGTVAVSGTIAIAGVVAIARRVAVAGVVGVVGAAIIAVVSGLGRGDGAADDRASVDARSPGEPAGPPLTRLELE